MNQTEQKRGAKCHQLKRRTAFTATSETNTLWLIYCMCASIILEFNQISATLETGLMMLSLYHGKQKTDPQHNVQNKQTKIIPILITELKLCCSVERFQPIISHCFDFVAHQLYGSVKPLSYFPYQKEFDLTEEKEKV